MHEKEIEILERPRPVRARRPCDVFRTWRKWDEWLAAAGDGESIDLVARVEIDYRRELTLADDRVTARAPGLPGHFQHPASRRSSCRAARGQPRRRRSWWPATPITARAADGTGARRSTLRRIRGWSRPSPSCPDVRELKERVSEFLEREVYPLEQRVAEAGRIDPEWTNELREKSWAEASPC